MAYRRRRYSSRRTYRSRGYGRSARGGYRYRGRSRYTRRRRAAPRSTIVLQVLGGQGMGMASPVNIGQKTNRVVRSRF